MVPKHYGNVLCTSILKVARSAFICSNQQLKTKKSVAFVPSSSCCMNNCGQSFPKITVKNLRYEKLRSLILQLYKNWSPLGLTDQKLGYWFISLFLLFSLEQRLVVYKKYFGSFICCRLFKSFNSPNQKRLYIIFWSPIRILIIISFGYHHFCVSLNHLKFYLSWKVCFNPIKLTVFYVISFFFSCV